MLYLTLITIMILTITVVNFERSKIKLPSPAEKQQTDVPEDLVPMSGRNLTEFRKLIHGR